MIAIRLSEVVSALTYALDLTEGRPEGHALRSTLIGMLLADHLQLTSKQRSALFYALILKDLGCSSTASKMTSIFGADDREAKSRYTTVEWTNILNRGLYVLRTAGTSESVLARVKRIIGIAAQANTISSDLISTRCERGAEIARQLGFEEETAQAILDLDEHWDGKGYPLRKKGENITMLGRILNFAQTLEVFYTAYGEEAACQVARSRRGT